MRPNSSHTGKRRRNRTRGQVEAPRLDAADRDACEEVIGHRFRSPELLDRAMTHRSAVQGRPSEWSNERLEFLGDRVLGLVMAETLLERFPGVREGELAPRLNLVVSREACARIGAEIGLGDFLIVDEAERSSGGAKKKSLLANVVEAAIGAVYLDAGLPAAKTFILRRWKQALMDVSSAPRDPKTALQEWAQGQGHPTPRYQHDGREGPDHAPVFTASVRVEGVPEVSGSGASKQEAERAAARAMLERIGLRNS